MAVQEFITGLQASRQYFSILIPKGLESNLDFISSHNVVNGECLVNLYPSTFSSQKNLSISLMMLMVIEMDDNSRVPGDNGA